MLVGGVEQLDQRPLQIGDVQLPRQVLGQQFAVAKPPFPPLAGAARHADDPLDLLQGEDGAAGVGHVGRQHLGRSQAGGELVGGDGPADRSLVPEGGDIPLGVGQGLPLRLQHALTVYCIRYAVALQRAFWTDPLSQGDGVAAEGADPGVEQAEGRREGPHPRMSRRKEPSPL